MICGSPPTRPPHGHLALVFPRSFMLRGGGAGLRLADDHKVWEWPWWGPCSSLTMMMLNLRPAAAALTLRPHTDETLTQVSAPCPGPCAPAEPLAQKSLLHEEAQSCKLIPLPVRLCSFRPLLWVLPDTSNDNLTCDCSCRVFCSLSNLGKLLHPSVTSFPHLGDGDFTKRNYLLDCFWLEKFTYMKLLK